jgi:Tfp pilus assembly protein PilF
MEKELNSILEEASEYLAEDNLTEAYKLYCECLNIKPDSLQALSEIGYILLELKEPQKALYYLKKAYSINENEVIVLNNYANCLMDLEKYKEAITLYLTAALLSLNESDSCLYNNLGWAFHQSGDYENALQYYNHAIFFSTEDDIKATAYCNRGKLRYCFLNEKEEGKKDLDIAKVFGDIEATLFLSEINRNSILYN